MASLSANPWQVAQPELVWIGGAAGAPGSVTGNLSTSDMPDSAGALGTLSDPGAILSGDGADIASAVGQVITTGVVAWTETGDTVAISSETRIEGNLSAVNSSDQFSAAGNVETDLGAMVATDKPDALDASGSTLVLGDMAVTGGAGTTVYPPVIITVDGLVLGRIGTDQYITL